MSPKTIPILPSSSLDATAAFYGALGFAEARRLPGEYLILEHPIGIELHFWLNPELVPEINPAGCYVRFEDEDSARVLHEEWVKADIPPGCLGRIETTDYGLLEFGVLDADRNALRIGGINRG